MSKANSLPMGMRTRPTFLLGKTASILFLALEAAPLVTLMFVPLVALCHNILDDAAAYGIKAVKYDKNYTNTAVHLIVLALEDLEPKSFQCVLFFLSSLSF